MTIHVKSEHRDDALIDPTLIPTEQTSSRSSPSASTNDSKPSIRSKTTSQKRSNDPNDSVISKKAKTQSSPSSATADSHPSLTYPSGYTDKQTFALMMFDFAVRNLPKGEVQAMTGLSAQQQKDLTRAGKGSLRRAFEGFVQGL